MVIMSIDTYEHQQSLIKLYGSLAESESDIVNGDNGEDFFEVARELRETVHGEI